MVRQNVYFKCDDTAEAERAKPNRYVSVIGEGGGG